MARQANIVEGENTVSSSANVMENSEVSKQLTIKQAIIMVLQPSQRGLTVEEIYNEIIKKRLYTFGAQNPINVLRTQIGSACIGSKYTYRASKDYFSSSVNANGEKIYFLLSETSADNTISCEAVNDVSSILETSLNQNVENSILCDIVDLKEGKNSIRQILNDHFLSLYGYSNIGILWSATQNLLPMFLNDNAINTIDDFWRFLVSAFRNELVFNSPHIWQIAPDYPQSSRGLIINLARKYGGVVTRRQIDDYFYRIKLTSLYNSFVLDKGEVLFCDNDKFILTEVVNPTDDRCYMISKALDSLFVSESVSYIILRDISSYWFTHLPELPNGLQWTPLLLQELLRIRSDIGYRVISPGLKGQALDTLGAAIVSSESAIESFADVVHWFCHENYKLPIKLTTEQLRLDIQEAGMLNGNELIYNMHKALKDYRFAFSDENLTVMILER